MVNKKLFFEAVRADRLIISYSKLQVTSIDAILDEIATQRVRDVRHIAYIFATAYHEAYDFTGKQTGRVQRIVPIHEIGTPQHLRSKWYYPYIGMGFVQLTHEENYQRYDRIIRNTGRFDGVNVMLNPTELLRPDVSAFVLVHGMVNGAYTGRRLRDYFNDKVNDPINARRIVNILDKAKLIAGYHKRFIKIVNASLEI